jgi:hypothetical protein
MGSNLRTIFPRFSAELHRAVRSWIGELSPFGIRFFGIGTFSGAPSAALGRGACRGVRVTGRSPGFFSATKFVCTEKQKKQNGK